MRAPLIALVLLLPLPALAEQVEGRVQVEKETVSLVQGQTTTPLVGSPDLALLDGEQVKLEVTRAKGKLTVTSVRSPARAEVQAIGRIRNGKTVLVTSDKKTLVPFGRVDLISTAKQRTYDVWRFPRAADGTQRVAVVAYEAETTKSWLILLSKPKLSLPTGGWVRGRGRSVWVEEERTGWTRIRVGDSVGWVQTSLVAPLEVTPKSGLSQALEGAGDGE